MADTTISGLSPLTPSAELVLPVSNNVSTGKVNLPGIYTIASNIAFPTVGSENQFVYNTGSLEKYKMLILTIRGYTTANTNTSISISGPAGVGRLSSNYASSTGASLFCQINLLSGLVQAIGQRTDQTENDSGIASDVYLRTHPYTPSSTSITFYTINTGHYFRAGTFTLQGIVG